MRFDKPYEDSELAVKFEDTRRLVVLDLDGTIVTGRPSLGEGRERERIMTLLKGAGVPYVFSSARTPELMMSEQAYRGSRRLGFDRPLPLRGRAGGGLRRYESLDHLVEFEHLYDPDAILGFGTGIYPKHRQGYLPDLAFTAQFGARWRGHMLDRIEQLSVDGDLVHALAPLEDEVAFACGETDVFPLPYRIQLEFPGKDGWKMKEDAAFRLRKSIPAIELVDESRPEQDRYVLYAVPKGASKQAMLSWLVERLCEATRRSSSEISIFAAGDSLTDLGSCLAVPEAESTFVLAGQSRLTPYITGCNGRARMFAGITLRWLTDDLRPSGRRGVFHYKGDPMRKLVVSDEANVTFSPAESVRIELEHWLNRQR